MLVLGLNATNYSNIDKSISRMMPLIILSVLVIISLVIWWIIDIIKVLTEREKGSKDVPIMESKKYQSAALLFNIFGGIFGFDRFYLGYRMNGILKMMTFGGFYILNVVDLISIYSGNIKDSQNTELLID